MKTVIAVYTGTGNSLYIASRFKDAEIHLVEEFLNGDYVLPESVDSLGIIFPVYCVGIPHPVKRFIEEVLGERDNSELGYLFAINTNGGMKGHANYQLEMLLAENGLRLAYANSIRMPDAYLPLTRKFPSQKEALEMMEKEEETLAEIINDIETNQIKLPRKGLFPHLVRKISENANRPHKKNGLTLSESCVGCGICEKICPNGNIEIVDGKPIFNDKCLSCYACYHRCPEHALKYKDVKGQYKGLQETSKLFRR